MSLTGIFAASTKKLLAELDVLRAGLSHSGVKGSGVEEAVRELLRRHLPDSIGVATGQVMDVGGNLSPQVDVILYDAGRTPMLLVTPDGQSATVPAEGVLACIEIKTHLTAELLDHCVSQAQVIKQMPRTAYLQTAGFRVQHEVYDRVYDEMPIYCTVLALETDNMYSDRLTQRTRDIPPHEQLDNIVYLSRGGTSGGVTISFVQDPDAIDHQFLISSTPSNESIFVDAETTESLLIWYLLLSDLLFKANIRPVNLAAYADEALHLTGKFSNPESSAKALEWVTSREDVMRGYKTGTTITVQRGFANREGLSGSELGAWFLALAEMLAKGAVMNMTPAMRETMRTMGVLAADVEHGDDHNFTAGDMNLDALRKAGHLLQSRPEIS